MSKKSKPTTNSKLEFSWPGPKSWRREINVVERFDDIIVWRARLSSEGSCCGFPVLSNFMEDIYDEVDRKKTLLYTQEIGEWLHKKLREHKIKYICAYVPDNREFLPEQLIFTAATFQRGVVLKSKHGRYTNTRWEWYSSDYEGIPSTFKLGKNEKAVHTLDV